MRKERKILNLNRKKNKNKENFKLLYLKLNFFITFFLTKQKKIIVIFAFTFFPSTFISSKFFLKENICGKIKIK